MYNRTPACRLWFGIAAIGLCAVAACSNADDPSASDGNSIALLTQKLKGYREPPVCSGATRPRPLPPEVRRNVMLIIGDGRQLEDEIAISRYLYGRDYRLAWDRVPYQGYVTTWDVTTYNAYAAAYGKATFDCDLLRSPGRI